MGEIRVRNLPAEIGDALERLAESDGRTVESYVRQLLKDAVRSHLRDFPVASEWLRAGFDEVRELIPGRQYLAWAGMRPFRITLSRSLTGELPEWNTEIEESNDVGEGAARISVWKRAIDVPQRLLGDSPAMALRDAMRWVADYAGVDPISRERAQEARGHNLSPRLARVVEQLDPHIGAATTYPRDNMVIWHTSDFDIYLNQVDESRAALMVYRRGEDWSITNGKADYFSLEGTEGPEILERLYDLGALRLAKLEQS